LQILHDEISTLQLELGQIEERNRDFKKDNAKLLQRWLDAKQAEANKMNEANEFYETMRTQRRTRPDPDGSKNAENSSARSSGNGDASGDKLSTQKKKNGTPSPQATTMDLTPNG
jgi:autophagy-related protein 16